MSINNPETTVPTPTVSPSGPAIEELTAFVQTNTEFYLKKWQKFIDNPKPRSNKNSWNWSAFFAGPFWYAYRKMYLYVAIYIVAVLVVSVILPDDRGISLAINIVLALMANYYYYYFANKKIKDIKAKYPNPEDQGREIKKAGGASWTGVFILLGAAVIAIIILVLVS